MGDRGNQCGRSLHPFTSSCAWVTEQYLPSLDDRHPHNHGSKVPRVFHAHQTQFSCSLQPHPHLTFRRGPGRGSLAAMVLCRRHMLAPGYYIFSIFPGPADAHHPRSRRGGRLYESTPAPVVSFSETFFTDVTSFCVLIVAVGTKHTHRLVSSFISTDSTYTTLRQLKASTKRKQTDRPVIVL